MGTYRYYFLTPADQIASVQEVEAANDAEAVEEARVLVAQHPRCTVEVWERSRLVRRHIWPSAPA
jgi:hypothetical protein